MTPRDKARQLIIKMYEFPAEGDTTWEEVKESGVEFLDCIYLAEAATDEILKEIEQVSDPNTIGLRYKYWMQVKEEIMKL